MRSFVVILATVMAILAHGDRSRLPADAFVDQAQAALEAGHLYQVDPLLLVAVAWEESRFEVGRVSTAGACGPMQVKPQWVPWSCDEIGDATVGYRAGALVLSRWRLACGEDPLACYNGGGEPGKRSRWYAARVRRTARQLWRQVELAQAIWARR